MLLAISLRLLEIALALILAQQNSSTVSILGILVAKGMAVSNAILLLDLIIAERKRGLSVRAAILAAGPVRLRPILMTTIVSLVVLVPVAFFPKIGIDAYSPLATVIIGGLSVSTVPTLFVVVPVPHQTFSDAALRRHYQLQVEHPELGRMFRMRSRESEIPANGGSEEVATGRVWIPICDKHGECTKHRVE